MQIDLSDIDELTALVDQRGDAGLAALWRQFLRSVDEGVTEYQRRKQRRDALLTRALVKMPGDSTWTRCSALAAQVRRFETRTWPRVRFMAETPDRFSELDSLLFHAFKIGVRVPDTAQGLVNVTQINSARNLGEGDIE